MFSAGLVAIAAVVIGGWIVSQIVPSVPGCSRAVALAVTSLAMAGVAVFAFNVVFAYVEGGYLASTSDGLVLATALGAMSGLLEGGLLVGLAVLVAVLADGRERDGR